MRSLFLFLLTIGLLLCLGRSPATAQRNAAELRTMKLVAGPSPYPANCYGVSAGEAPFVGSVVEPQVAVDPGNPNHMIGVWQQDRFATGGASGVRAATTVDGGNAWTISAAAFSLCTGGAFERATDPWVTIAADGAAYQIAMPFNASDGAHAIMVSRSDDGGYSWGKPVRLVQKNPSSLDKPTIAADPHDSSYVYAVWTGQGGAAAMSRSLDNGKTWSAPTAIFLPCAGCAAYDNNVLVLPDGSVADLFIWSQTATVAQFAIIVSHDHGGAWSSPAVIAAPQIANESKPGPAVRGGGPGFAVDPQTGAIYAAWQDARFASMTVTGIAFAKSTDGGRTWSPPKQVNTAVDAWAFNPGLAVASDGTIAVTYYDTRNDTAGANTLLTSCWQLESSDGGETWTETSLAGPFDIATAALAEGGLYFVGDYQGLAASSGFFALFVATAPGGTPRTSNLYSVTTPPARTVHQRPRDPIR